MLRHTSPGFWVRKGMQYGCRTASEPKKQQLQWQLAAILRSKVITSLLTTAQHRRPSAPESAPPCPARTD